MADTLAANPTLSPVDAPRGGARVSYVIVSPMRNEAAHIERVIQSVAAQTSRPSQWVIVNDGSTDETGAILDRCANSHPWISVVHLPGRAQRVPGTAVIAAFNEGLTAMRSHDWDFIVKLDGDLILMPDYFERCLQEFAADPGLGVGGGIVFHYENGQRVIEPNPKFHVRGATKIYRRACWDQLEGLLVAPGWDTLDEVKANMLGWKTRSFPELQLEHLRPTGAADGTWRNAVKNGEANYRSGYHPLFMMLKCVKRLLAPPYVIGSAGLFWGYVRGALAGVPQVPDKQLIAYLRAQQLRRLFLRESIWK